MIQVYTQISLDRLDMTRQEVEEFIEQLNAATGKGYARALITTDNKLAIDARLANQLNL